MNQTRILVVGASSGIGYGLAKELALKGNLVAAVARRQDKLESLAKEAGNGLRVYVHDVTNFSEVPDLFTQIAKDLGGLDTIYYCSGVMPAVNEGEFNFEKDHQMIETNLLGAIAWLNQAALRFKHAGAGTIVGIGSVAGDRGRQGQPVYNTSKAALATYLEALRNRLSRHGVKVVTIKPGPVDTEMTRAVGIKNGMDLNRAVAIIIQKSSRNGEHYLSFKHRLIFYILKRIPSPLFRKLKI